MESQPNKMYEQILLEWPVEEYRRHERSNRWYVVAISTALFFLIFSVFTSNFLFAVIVIIASLIIILNDARPAAQVPFKITDSGLAIGRRFVDYDELKSFALVYKPNYNIKNLYFEFKGILKQRLSVPLKNQEPISVRDTLLRYLPEDHDRTDPPLSEALADLFKL